MMKNLPMFLICLSVGWSSSLYAAKVNAEKTVTVDGVTRKYVLYVPDKVSDAPALVFSLHGASGHDTDRSPFRTSVADAQGCIVVYPQGENQYFPVFGGSIPGWNATGAPNEDLDFFKAIIEQVASSYAIDRSRIYCCGFSNGGMMTYSNASAASDVFAAFASISGFQLNEFHHRPTGYRPTPFLHIHGKADGFVKYSCMPVIRDNMVARNGCNPVPQVTTVAGKYTKSVYEAGEGGFPYVYYEVDDMGHSDYTDRTDDGNSALTMWNFMSQYTLDDACDASLKWRLNIDADGFDPKAHHWKVSADATRFEYGTPKKANNADNNVYSSLQFEAGNYVLNLKAEGNAGECIYVQVATLDGSRTLCCKKVDVGQEAVIPLSVDAYTECKLTILKSAAEVKCSAFAFHACEDVASPQNCIDAELPEAPAAQESGTLIEIPQDQGKQLDTFTRTAMVEGADYNTYTATGDLQIAFKMMNVDVADCDYVVVKFHEPVAAGWNLAFWEGNTLVSVPEGATEYRFELEPAMIEKKLLPQICMMTFFGGYVSPLVAKVKGVYKHSLKEAPAGLEAVASSPTPSVVYTMDGRRCVDALLQTPGFRVVKMGDGKVRKVWVRGMN